MTPEEYESNYNNTIYLVVHDHYDEQWPMMAFNRNEDAQSYIDQSEDKHLSTYRVDLYVDNMVDFAAL